MLPLALLLSAMATAAIATAAATPPRRHVLFVLIDDLGYADVGYHGKAVGAAVRTPAIDELALAGVRLEQYYVVQLCSPTRTSLLSGRYPYNIGMNEEVIVDGHPSCMPTTVATLADRLSASGWATSAYGKWDAGMTSWGCTPTCRGFDHFYGFYNAFNDYFTHHVGAGLDFRDDVTPVTDQTGQYACATDPAGHYRCHNDSAHYFTEIVTANAIGWLEAAVAANASASTFAYLAHESNHAPMQVPPRWIAGHCAQQIPEENPTRRMLCGMMAAVDSSVANMTAAYKRLGLWPQTVVIFSTDNGGNTDTGGNNSPLRGQKATTWEGGVRGVGWVGGGLPVLQRAAVSRALMHVSDWYPTIVHGIAGLDVGVAADGTPPLDGLDAWPAITTGAPSLRNEILLNLANVGGSPRVQGQGAIRIGKWKLLAGHTCLWGQRDATYGCGSCGSRDGQAHNGVPLAVSAATSPPFCPNGWVPPPESAKPMPVPPPDVPCPSGTSGGGCEFNNTNYTEGGLWLFDLDLDPNEYHDVAAANPAVVQQLNARLQEFNKTQIPQQNAPMDPRSNPAHFGGVWTPWEGDPDPAKCAKPPPPSHCSIVGCQSCMDVPYGAHIPKVGCTLSGWASYAGYSGPALTARAKIDGVFAANATANIHRKIAGDHGFVLEFSAADCEKLQGGSHWVTVEALSGDGSTCFGLKDGPFCTIDTDGPQSKAKNGTWARSTNPKCPPNPPSYC